jgi:ERCC4-type nuclease
MFTIKNDKLYHDGVLFGPTYNLYVDANELKDVPYGVHSWLIRRPMPSRIDMVFVAGDKVVGIESKKANDLRSSISQGRLSRQMRTLIDEVDVPCLLMRGVPKKWRGIKRQNSFNEDIFDIWEELVQLQALGVYILPGPYDDALVLKWLNRYGPALSGGRAALAAIKSTDTKRAKSKRKGWFLENIKGVGVKIATKLHSHFGSTRGALLAEPNEWRQLGVPKAVVDRKEEALK